MQTRFLFKILLSILVLFTFYSLYLVFFDSNGVSLNKKLKLQWINEEEQNKIIIHENISLEEEIRSMQNNSEFSETYAREELDLILPGENLVKIDISDIDPDD